MMDPHEPITIRTPAGSQTFDPRDLTSPKSDTYVLAKQWLYADQVPADERTDVFAKEVQLNDQWIWEGDEQIPELVAQIISFGTRYYAIEDGYAPFTTAEIGRAFELMEKYAISNPLNRKMAAALRAAHENGNADPREPASPEA